MSLSYSEKNIIAKRQAREARQSKNRRELEERKRNGLDTMVEYISGRVYPSTNVNTVSQRGEKPKLSPQQMFHKEQEFEFLTKKPTIRCEHSADPRDIIGVVTEMWYEPSDSWMWMEGKFFNREKATEILRNNSFESAFSLCYGASTDYLNFIEISLTSNPDFPKATIEYCHSAEQQSGNSALIVLPLKTGEVIPPNYFIMSLQDDIPSYMVLMQNGTILVKDQDRVKDAQAYAASHGLDPGRVFFRDISAFNNMTPEQQQQQILREIGTVDAAVQMLEQKEAELKALREKDAKYQEEHQRKLMEQQKQLDSQLFQEWRPIINDLTSVIPESDRSAVAEHLTITALSNPEVNAALRMAAGRLSMNKSEYEQLKRENEMLKQRVPFQSSTQNLPLGQQKTHAEQYQNSVLPPLTQPQPVTIAAHSASSSSGSSLQSPVPSSFGTQRAMSLSTLWRQLEASATAPGTGLTQPQASGSIPGSSTQQQVPGTVDINQHSASAKRDRWEWNGMSVFPTGAGAGQNHASSGSSEKVLIYSHNAGSGQRSGTSGSLRRPKPLKGCPIEVPEKPFCDSLTRASTNADVVKARIGDIITGHLPVGHVPHDWLEHNQFTFNPELFTAIAIGDLSSLGQTNESAGIVGYDDEKFRSSALGKTKWAQSPHIRNHVVPTEKFEEYAEQWWNERKRMRV